MTNSTEFERLRRLHKVLVMFYQQNISQAKIAEMTGLSHTTVNRLVKEGQERGLVEITVKSPFGSMLDLGTLIAEMGRIDNAIVVPEVSTDPRITIKSTADAAAAALFEKLQDGMTIAISGGVGVSAIVEAMKPKRTYDVTVVPGTGGVQGKYYTDVNQVSMAMAEKLGGRALQLHAPIIAGSREARDTLLDERSIRDVFDIARKADIAVMGIGSVRASTSTYLSLDDDIDPAEVLAAGASGELLAHLISKDGTPCDYSGNDRVVALTLEELRQIPHRFAIASGQHKAEPIAAILRGDFLTTLAIDEQTAYAVSDILKGDA
jgi:DNA-binding transcriptional regulator LsrR (DeoR family)